MDTLNTNRPSLKIQNLKVNLNEINGRTIIKGVSIEIFPGEVHVLMGPNGVGKSTLSHALMGNPKYQIIDGKIFLNGEDITALPPDIRAKKRLFLAFQNPTAIPGVTIGNFLRACIRQVRGHEVEAKNMRSLIQQEAENLQLPTRFLSRHLNDGFSGGEKKKLETLQLRLLRPHYAILDETDSGLDIDALKLVAKNIEEMKNWGCGFLLITHYQKILEYIKPHLIHILMDGRTIKSGQLELASLLEEKGYQWFMENDHATVT